MSSNYININNQKLYYEHYQNHPDKPTLVFLHDSLGCVQLWRDFPERLAEQTQCNILMYDRLGYGKSAPMPTYVRPTNYMELESDILAELLEQLDIKDAILFGHSDGGTIALIAASKYPERLKAIIVEAAHIFVEEVTLKGIHEAMEAYKATNLHERLTRYHGDNTTNLFKAWTETWVREDYRDWNIEYMLPAIKTPLLFIQGANDEYGTMAQVDKTIQQVSGFAEKYMIPDVGHTPHKEVPELVLEKVTEFIRHL